VFDLFLRICLAGLLLAVCAAPAAAQVPLEKLDAAWLARLERSGGGVLARGRSERLTWSPPRRLLLDRARSSLRVDVAENAGAGRGQGVALGIVDSGIDISHPDLRNADGTTRVAWWIDFTQNPAGRHPQLESALGCSPEVGLRCQILAAADLDERLQNGVAGDEPSDPVGHGTHVASIAAGNGLASGSGFVGVAPEATLIVARVTGGAGTIADSDVVLATSFVFERAAELGMPAVVNLSLGGDFGAHDSSSELSRALAAFVGPSSPGRAIVVAGGNSGEVYTGLLTDAAEQLGIHTELTVSAAAPVELPLLTPMPASGADTTRATLFVWINLYPSETLSVGLALPDGSRIDPILEGEVASTDSGELAAIVLHGLGGGEAEALIDDFSELSADQLLPSAGAAVILIDGAWSAGAPFQILLEGEGRAEAWVQSEGDLAPERGSLGALFTGATAAQTVTIPASDADLIAVGASINRVGWIASDGTRVSVEGIASAQPLALGAAAFFSSAGPNATGDIKPDLLAPGAFVIGAMASSADPRSGGRGVFSGGLCSGAACQVVSDGYAVTAGTSMAAPMVSGAAALLLEVNPSLTLPELRAVLQAGSSPLALAPDVSGREGGGTLDVAGAFDALSSTPRSAAERPDAGQSRLRAAAGLLVPDPVRSLVVQLWLRDASGGVFDADVGRLRAAVTGGELRSELSRRGPGLYALRVGAPLASPEPMLRLELFVDDQPLSTLELPVQVTAASAPSRSADEGCGLSAPASRGTRELGLWFGAGCALAAVRRRSLRSRRCTP
jgi:subtilisin family serine protease